MVRLFYLVYEKLKQAVGHFPRHKPLEPSRAVSRAQFLKAKKNDPVLVFSFVRSDRPIQQTLIPSYSTKNRPTHPRGVKP